MQHRVLREVFFSHPNWSFICFYLYYKHGCWLCESFAKHVRPLISLAMFWFCCVMTYAINSPAFWSLDELWRNSRQAANCFCIVCWFRDQSLFATLIFLTLNHSRCVSAAFHSDINHLCSCSDSLSGRTSVRNSVCRWIYPRALLLMMSKLLWRLLVSSLIGSCHLRFDAFCPVWFWLLFDFSSPLDFKWSRASMNRVPSRASHRTWSSTFLACYLLTHLGFPILQTGFGYLEWWIGRCCCDDLSWSSQSELGAVNQPIHNSPITIGFVSGLPCYPLLILSFGLCQISPCR